MHNLPCKTVRPEPADHRAHAHSLAAVIASMKRRWHALSHEPLVFMLLVWALLFALAAFINLHT